MAEITDSLDRLLIGLDNLGSIASTVSAQFTSAVGGFQGTFDVVAENLTNQIAHLSEVTAAVGSNLTIQLGELIDAVTGMARAGGAAAPDHSDKEFNFDEHGQHVPDNSGKEFNFDEHGQHIPAAGSLPERSPLHTLPEVPALKGLPDNTPAQQAARKEAGPKQLDLFGPLKEAMSGLATVATQLGSRFGALTAPFAAAGGAMSGLAKAGGETFAAFGPAGAAVSAATQGFERIVGVMSSFAEVAAPGVMFEFNRALKDLQATVGTAFVPFFSAMIGITRAVAGELYPAMLALRPVFSALAGVVGAVLVPVANLFGTVLQALMPFFNALLAPLGVLTSLFGFLLAPIGAALTAIGSLVSVFQTALTPVFKLIDLFVQLTAAFNPAMILLQGLSMILGGVASMFAALTAVLDPVFVVLQYVADEFAVVGQLLGAVFGAAIQVIVDAFTALLPKIDIGDALQAIHSAFLTLGKALIQFAVWLAGLFGQKNFGQQIHDQLQKASGAANKPHAVAAPENVHTANLDSIGKDMASASARAVGTGGEPKEKTQGQLLEELSKVALETKSESAINFDGLKQQIKDSIAGVGTDVGAGFDKFGKYLFDTATAVAKQTLEVLDPRNIVKFNPDSVKNRIPTWEDFKKSSANPLRGLPGG